MVVTVQDGGKIGEERRVKLACKHLFSPISTSDVLDSYNWLIELNSIKAGEFGKNVPEAPVFYL